MGGPKHTKVGYAERGISYSTTRRLLSWLVVGLVGATNGGCASGASASTKTGSVVDPGGDPLLAVSPDKLFAYGQAYASRGDALRAEEYLNAAMQRGFPAERVMPLLLRACIAGSRLGAALQYAGPYLQLHPGDTRLRFLVATIRLALRDLDEAEQELVRVLRDAPEMAEAHYFMGIVLRDHRHDNAAAAIRFRSYRELTPNGLHGAEVAAWLKEYAALAQTPPVVVPSVATAAVGGEVTDHPTQVESSP